MKWSCQRELGKAGKEEKASFFVHYIGFQLKKWAKLKVHLSTSKDLYCTQPFPPQKKKKKSGLKVGLRTSNDLIQKIKIHHMYTQTFGF